MKYLIKKYGEIEVAWLLELNGGGMTHGQQFIPVVKRVCGKVGRAFEFCAGPGFIGFSLLAEGLCRYLCVADANPLAVEALKETVRRNRLIDRVSVYLSDGLKGIPKTEKWDLVEPTPPHFSGSKDNENPKGFSRFGKQTNENPRFSRFGKQTNENPRFSRFGKQTSGKPAGFQGLPTQTASKHAATNKTAECWLIEDYDWKIHEEFYLNAQKFLTPHGKILMQENYLGSGEKDFIPLIEAGNLSLKRSFMYKVQDEKSVNSYYFLEIENAAEAQRNEAEIQTLQEGREGYGSGKPAGFQGLLTQTIQGLLMQTEEIKPIRLSYPQRKVIKLAPWQKYQFDLKNGTQREIHAGFYRESPPAFFKQKPMLSVSPGERKKSNIFHLTKGDYILIDIDTQEKIAEVKVE